MLRQTLLLHTSNFESDAFQQIYMLDKMVYNL